MPELRRGVCRGRAPVIPNTTTRRRTLASKRSEHLVGNYIKTRAAVAKELAEAKVKARAVGGNLVEKRTTRLTKRKEQEKGKEKEKEEEQVIVISEKESVSERKKGQKGEAEGDKKGGEGVMGDDSGGLSANKKVTRQEEEGSNTPFPERV